MYLNRLAVNVTMLVSYHMTTDDVCRQHHPCEMRGGGWTEGGGVVAPALQGGGEGASGEEGGGGGG